MYFKIILNLNPNTKIDLNNTHLVMRLTFKDTNTSRIYLRPEKPIRDITADTLVTGPVSFISEHVAGTETELNSISEIVITVVSDSAKNKNLQPDTVSITSIEATIIKTDNPFQRIYSLNTKILQPIICIESAVSNLVSILTNNLNETGQFALIETNKKSLIVKDINANKHYEIIIKDN